MIDVAAGVLLALAGRRIATVLIRWAWFRFAYSSPSGDRWDNRALFGRYTEGTTLPAWAGIVRKVIES